MAYLTEEDYKIVARVAIIQQIINTEEVVRFQAEISAQAEAESYLRGLYDVVNIFNKEGSERNQFLVMILVDMVLYHIYSRIQPDKIPQLRIDRYDSAIDWLEKVSKGDLSPDLPLKETEDGKPISTWAVNSQPKQNWHF